MHHLRSNFSIKDLGQLNYFQGIEAHFDSNGLLLSQQKYIFDLLHWARMTNVMLVAIPMSSSHKLCLIVTLFHDPTIYHSTVGALQYVLLTRPDLSFAINHPCQYMHHPIVSHWTAIKQILWYLKATSMHSLHITPSSSNLLHSYFDADQIDCPDDHCSTNVYLIFHYNNLIS